MLTALDDASLTRTHPVFSTALLAALVYDYMKPYTISFVLPALGQRSTSPKPGRLPIRRRAHRDRRWRRGVMGDRVAGGAYGFELCPPVRANRRPCLLLRLGLATSGS